MYLHYRIFNTGSPRNIVAGSQANLDQLYEYYEREREEAQQQRVERMKRRRESERGYGEIEQNGKDDHKGIFAKVTKAFGVKLEKQGGER